MKAEKSTLKTVSKQEKELESGDDRYLRRLQVTGRGSYIVSIPKHWVEEAGLRKGGRVEFSRQEERGLLLTPYDSAKSEEDWSRCTISLGNDANPEAVSRLIISLYVVGYSTIEIRSRSGSLPAAVRETIREVARGKLVGTELVTESSQSATLQVLVTRPQLLVPDALRRMWSITGSMQQDAMESLANSDKELAKQVLKIDDEIDRFSLYIIRQLKWAVKHPPLVEKVGLRSTVECLGYRIITKSVERSADHAARVASSVLVLANPLSPPLMKEAHALSQLSFKMMDTAVRALFAEDYQLAETVLVEREKVSGLESKFVERLLKEKLPATDLSANRLISESLRRIGEYATDVAEVVLNLTVQEAIEKPLAAA